MNRAPGASVIVVLGLLLSCTAVAACSRGDGGAASEPGSLGARRAATADSFLRLAAMPPLDSLADTTIRWLALFGNSSINPARTESLRAENDRRERAAQDRERRSAAAAAPVAERVPRIREAASRLRYAGYRQGICRPPGDARIERLVRDHPDYLDDEHVAIVCQVIEGLVTSEQVALAWGRPRRVSTQQTARGREELWTYDFDRFNTKRLLFVNGLRDREATCPRTAADARFSARVDSLCPAAVGGSGPP